jgi:hypothetical protein
MANIANVSTTAENLHIQFWHSSRTSTHPISAQKQNIYKSNVGTAAENLHFQCWHNSRKSTHPMLAQQQNIYTSNVGTATQDLIGNVCTQAEMLPKLIQENNI